MSQGLAALRPQCQWTRISLSLTTPLTIGIKLGFKQHRESHYQSHFLPKTTVSTLISVIILTGRLLPSLRAAKGAHKRHQGHIYSYHRVQNSYWLFKKP
jgi:hypothetical protein